MLDISAALAPLASQAAAANNLFFKLAFLHTTPAAEQYSSLSVWLQRVLLGARHDSRPSLCNSLCGVDVCTTEVLGASGVVSMISPSEVAGARCIACPSLDPAQDDFNDGL